MWIFVDNVSIHVFPSALLRLRIRTSPPCRHRMRSICSRGYVFGAKRTHSFLKQSMYVKALCKRKVKGSSTKGKVLNVEHSIADFGMRIAEWQPDRGRGAEVEQKR